MMQKNILAFDHPGEQTGQPYYDNFANVYVQQNCSLFFRLFRTKIVVFLQKFDQSIKTRSVGISW